jgi:hypothetical protein
MKKLQKVPCKNFYSKIKFFEFNFFNSHEKYWKVKTVLERKFLLSLRIIKFSQSQYWGFCVYRKRQFSQWRLRKQKQKIYLALLLHMHMRKSPRILCRSWKFLFHRINFKNFKIFLQINFKNFKIFLIITRVKIFTSSRISKFFLKNCKNEKTQKIPWKKFIRNIKSFEFNFHE